MCVADGGPQRVLPTGRHLPDEFTGATAAAPGSLDQRVPTWSRIWLGRKTSRSCWPPEAPQPAVVVTDAGAHESSVSSEEFEVAFEPVA